MTARLEKWSCCVRPDVFLFLPEVDTPSLHGTVYDDPRFNDGDEITTSPIVRASGKQVWTRSGTEYLLGEVDPQYREYLRTIRPNWDENNPIGDGE